MLTVDGEVEQPIQLHSEELRCLDDGSVVVSQRVPGLEGEAVALLAVLKRVRPLASVTHLIFYAADQFQADIPVRDLEHAFLLYRRQGGYQPVRLYVPDGSSQCLNVKSVIRIEAVARKGSAADEQADFGFKQVIAPESLKRAERDR